MAESVGPSQRNSDEDSVGQEAVCWFHTLGEEVVTVAVAPSDEEVFECSGCGHMSDHIRGHDRALAEANLHASTCRAVSRPRTQEAVELAREISADLRAELPRLEARAAAGIALSAAVLIGVVGQTPVTQPVYTFSVVGAGLLTLALLSFFSVLLPAPTKAHGPIISSATDETSLATSLGSWDASRYLTSLVLELSGIVRAKYQRLTFALTVAALAIVTVALGASLSLSGA